MYTASMSLLSLLFEQPLLFAVVIGIFLFTLSLHEACHALASSLLGDPTAKRMNRLTLNPLAHIDPLGFIALLTIGFGWGKPVPFNPYNLRFRRWGPVMVAIAGPLSNFIVGAIASILYARLVPFLSGDNLLIFVLQYLASLNFLLMVFNLIPIPPLDGSKLLLAFLAQTRSSRAASFLETQGPMLLMLLVVLDSFTSLGLFAWIGFVANALFRFFAS